MLAIDLLCGARMLRFCAFYGVHMGTVIYYDYDYIMIMIIVCHVRLEQTMIIQSARGNSWLFFLCQKC